MKIDCLPPGYIELQDVMGNDLAIVNAARVSYLGHSKGEEADKKLLFYLMKNRHTSPFEMCEMKFVVYCPLFVARQWMRHRTWSYNEVSRRYTDESIEFYFPNEWRGQSTNNKQASNDEKIEYLNYKYSNGDVWWQPPVNSQVEFLVHEAMKLYNVMIDTGIAREQARMVLPQNMMTTFVAKADLHNILHFCQLRSHEHAQYEIRVYSDAILEMIKEKFPWTYEAYHVSL